MFVVDYRFFIYNYLFADKIFLRVDHFFYFLKKYFFSYDKFFFKVDTLSFILLRANLEYFRAFKYNEYLFNNTRFTSRKFKYGLSIRQPSYSLMVSYFPIL